MAILTVHEIRQVFKLPLRQCEGLVNSLFKLIHIDLQCPSYSVLSKRLKKLNLTRPFYRKSHCYNKDIKAIAIDSSGLKCFGYEEWHIHKYQIQEKKAYKKLHLVVDNHNIIQSSELTDSHVQDQSVVNKLIQPIDNKLRFRSIRKSELVRYRLILIRKCTTSYWIMFSFFKAFSKSSPWNSTSTLNRG